MKMIEKYKSMGIKSEDEAFEYILANLKDTIRTYDFFVAWEKVLGNVSDIEVSLNILNALIGKDDIAEKLKGLIIKYPQIVPVLPILIAVRDEKIKVADLGGDTEYSFKKQKEYTDTEIDKIVFFSEECGLLGVLSDRSIKSLVDYCTGVEVGLDTNARKNRSGKAMESLTEVYIKAICEKYGYSYLPQATAAKIKTEFGKDVPTDKADRQYDFAIDVGRKVYLVEVNYYGSGGSKLKATAGEYKSLFELMQTTVDVGFIWVTDGLGWLTARHPLRETFDATDYVMNLEMIEDGLLEEILTKGL